MGPGRSEELYDVATHERSLVLGLHRVFRRVATRHSRRQPHLLSLLCKKCQHHHGVRPAAAVLITRGRVPARFSLANYRGRSSPPRLLQTRRTQPGTGYHVTSPRGPSRGVPRSPQSLSFAPCPQPAVRHVTLPHQPSPTR